MFPFIFRQFAKIGLISSMWLIILRAEDIDFKSLTKREMKLSLIPRIEILRAFLQAFEVNIGASTQPIEQQN